MRNVSCKNGVFPHEHSPQESRKLSDRGSTFSGAGMDCMSSLYRMYIHLAGAPTENLRVDACARRCRDASHRRTQGFRTTIELGFGLKQGKELRNFEVLDVTNFHSLDCAAQRVQRRFGTAIVTRHRCSLDLQRCSTIPALTTMIGETLVPWSGYQWFSGTRILLFGDAPRSPTTSCPQQTIG